MRFKQMSDGHWESIEDKKAEKDSFSAPATETKKPPGRPKKIEQEQDGESGA